MNTIPKIIRDAKLHRLELTDFEVRMLIKALDRCIDGEDDSEHTRANLTPQFLTLRGILRRSVPS
jgi:hypothetical protein